jgi:hypothetical protein
MLSGAGETVARSTNIRRTRCSGVSAPLKDGATIFGRAATAPPFHRMGTVSMIHLSVVQQGKPMHPVTIRPPILTPAQKVSHIARRGACPRGGGIGISRGSGETVAGRQISDAHAAAAFPHFTVWPAVATTEHPVGLAQPRPRKSGRLSTRSQGLSRHPLHGPPGRQRNEKIRSAMWPAQCLLCSKADMAGLAHMSAQVSSRRSDSTAKR